MADGNKVKEVCAYTKACITPGELVRLAGTPQSYCPTHLRVVSGAVSIGSSMQALISTAGSGRVRFGKSRWLGATAELLKYQ